MKTFLCSLAALGLSSTILLTSADARACGGCFVQQSESTQVTGHRMILSVSNEKTTLWDQIEYSGEPESFAWVLPIQGQVEIGLSSDALFEQLEALTSVQILSPTVVCPPPTCPGPPNAGVSASYSATSGGGVTVLAQQTVGPFETVQLSSSDPQALLAWLDLHQFSVPPEIAPVVAEYVAEGFDFLAMKLVPGEPVTSMQPVRVTSMGAGLGLPLRMVAAGTGAITPITLWIAGEGRYEPANFPSFTIDPSQLVWSWDTQSSNYSALRQLGFDASDGEAWLIESASPASPGDSIGSPLLGLVSISPEESGYDPDPLVAEELCAEDLADLYGSLDPSSFWLTRIHAQLPREALGTDLQIGASADQSSVSRILQASQAVGTPPPCPPPPDCSTTGAGGTGGADGQGGTGGGGFDEGFCSVEGPVGAASGGLSLAAVAAIAGLGALGARRRRQKRAGGGSPRPA